VRRIEIDGHQQHYKGWFHRWGQQGDEVVAIIEWEGGKVSLMSTRSYSFTFVTPPPTPTSEGVK
jgi:hypothetical protein